jgi:hypothetical protein
MLGGGMPGMGGGPMNMVQQFQRFRQEMQGKNPQEEINKLLQSGKISQQQLNQAQQMAQQFKGLLK